MTTTEEHYEADAVFDKAAIEADIVAGARAFTKLLNHAADDWTSWSITIIGLRGLRDLARAQAHTADIHSYAYRQAMSRLLQLRKYSVYDQIDKPTRSACYKLMDTVEDLSVWYAALPPADKLRWKHPQSIVKHAPRNLVEGGKGHNRPKAKGQKKPVTSAEIERLKALLIQVIKRLIKYEPDATDLLDQITPADPDDGVPDFGKPETKDKKKGTKVLTNIGGLDVVMDDD
jgi:hypothetical protein